MIAKIILPWFGGSSAVWTTCLLFFQLVLLLGYLYSHALVRYAKPRVQMAIHIGLLAVSALALPIYPSASWKPADPSQPALRILALLSITVGMPFFLLSSTGPLLQAWYARRFKNAMPYRLYALSNAGSMLALLSYPVLFEPVYATHEQAIMWSVAYGAFAVLCAFVAFRSGTGPALELEIECRRRRKADRSASISSGCSAGVRFRPAAGHHEPPLAERGRHSVPMGAAAKRVPALIHSVFRERRMVSPEPIPATAGGGAGVHGVFHVYRECRQHSHQGRACRCS